MIELKHITKVMALAMGILVMVCGTGLADPIGDGTVIGIDIGQAGTTTPNWNNFTTASHTITAGSVVDTGGTVVDAVGIAWTSGGGGFAGGWTGWAEVPAGSLADVPDTATSDIAWGSGGGSTHTLVISGLNTAFTYDIAVVSQSGSAVAGRTEITTVTGASVTNSSITRHNADAPINSASEGLYHSFTDVAPTAGGVLTIACSDLANNPAVNAVRLTAIAPDTTPPSWIATWPQVDTVTTDGATARGQIDEDGTAYYVVVADGAGAPSSAQVKAGQDSGGGAALASGSMALSASTEGTDTFSGLSAGTAHDVYLVAEDDAGSPNIQASPVKVDFTTLASDTTPPTWVATWPQVDTATTNGATARAQIDENGSAYYVVVADGDGAPNSAQVKAGQDSGGGAALASGSIALSAATEGTDAFSGLSDGTAYDVYFVAEDDEGTPNIQASPVLVEFTTTVAVTYTDSQLDLTQWRTASVDKPYDTDGDDIIGTLGYHLFGAAGEYASPKNGANGPLASLPAYITVIKNSSLELQYGYASIDNPVDGTPATIVSGTTSGSPNGNALIATIGFGAGVPSALTMSLMHDNLDGAGFNTSGYEIRAPDGTTVLATINASNNNLTPDWHYFGISGLADGASIQVWSAGGNYPTLGGIMFDASAPTPDTTPPSWIATWPQVDTETTDGATARAQIDEAGTAYYVVLTDGATAPSSAQVKAGTDASDAAALTNGSITLSASTEGTDAFSGLSAGTAYDVYFVAEDDEGTPNIQASPVKVDFTTLASDTTPPTWVATWPQVDTATTNGATARGQINEDGTAYYVVVADGAGAPSSAQVKAGQDSGGGAALASGSIALTANTENTDAFSGLSEYTAYDVYFVAEDDEGTPNIQASPTLVAFTTLGGIAIGRAIGIDFGPTAPVGNFNQYSTAGAGTIPAGSLIDTSGVVVAGVSLTVSGPGMWSNNDAADSTDLPGQPAFFDDTHLTDWIGENRGGGSDIGLTFAGLNDALLYELVIGSAFIANATDTDTEWTVDGQTATSVHDSGADAYVTFANLTTDGSGDLVITSDKAAAVNEITVVSALRLTAQAPDTTPPSWVATWPQVDTVTTDGATARGQIDEDGTAYYVVVADGAGAPSSVQVKAGQDSGGGAALASGSIALSASTEGADAFSGLNAGTAYDVYFVAEDDEGTPNIQASPVKVDFTTAASDTTPPAWIATWPQVDTETTSGATARAQIDENGTAYYVVLADGAGAPSSAQVKAGQDSGGGAALAGGSIALTASTEGTDTFSGLSDSTAYDVYFVAEDDEGTPNIQASPTLVEFTTMAPITVGTVIGIDIGTTTTPNWNNIISKIQIIAAGSVVDINGSVVAGVSIDADIGEGGAVLGTSFPGWAEYPAGSLPDVLESVTADFSYANGGGDHNLVIAGLDTALTYDIVVITQTGTAVVRTDTVTVTGASVANSIIPRYVAGGAVDSSYEGLYHSLTAVAPTAGGSITINSVDNAGNPSINAVRLEVFTPRGTLFKFK